MSYGLNMLKNEILSRMYKLLFFHTLTVDGDQFRHFANAPFTVYCSTKNKSHVGLEQREGEINGISI